MTPDTARLRWRCRRGMRELDAVLEAFLERDFLALADSDKRRFEALLDLTDPELYGYLVRRHEPDDPDTARLVSRIRRSLEDRA
ncbi:MAG TPA: succinate dehydrogenase assembly factor 2 [Gammaproteobacteria bacterium]|nr:succinate dehydrogenase assembly factor 2 [Gammaproteobacteria bacterium]